MDEAEDFLTDLLADLQTLCVAHGSSGIPDTELERVCMELVRLRCRRSALAPGAPELST